VPVKTPREIVDKLYDESRKAVQLPAVQQKFAGLGGEPMNMTQAEFDKYIRADIARNAALVTAAGIKPN
jgi:tripartite-type tricarboxylate transporter receptor subunit TctC